jgi:hypothetical protein
MIASFFRDRGLTADTRVICGRLPPKGWPLTVQIRWPPTQGSLTLKTCPCIMTWPAIGGWPLTQGPAQKRFYCIEESRKIQYGCRRPSWIAFSSKLNSHIYNIIIPFGPKFSTVSRYEQGFSRYGQNLNLGLFRPFGPKFRAFRAIQCHPSTYTASGSLISIFLPNYQKSYWTVREKLAEKWNLGLFGPFGPKFRAFRTIQAYPSE